MNCLFFEQKIQVCVFMCVYERSKQDYIPIFHQISGCTSSLLTLDCFALQSPRHVWLLQPHGLQHARLSCPSPSSRVWIGLRHANPGLKMIHVYLECSTQNLEYIGFWPVATSSPLNPSIHWGFLTALNLK